MSRRILVVEDEPRIADFVAEGLRAEGFSTSTVASAREASIAVSTGEFDLMILDLGLPDEDGFQVLRRLRGSGSTLPVVILTARGGIDDTVAGLEGGADDYMVKPFRFEELLARVRLRLRGPQDAGTAEPTVLAHGGVALDLRTRRARAAGRTIDLTPREFALLETFLRHPGQVLTREQLLSHVWGYDYDPGSNVIDVYVRYLRQKLGDDIITTVRGIGYRSGT